MFNQLSRIYHHISGGSLDREQEKDYYAHMCRDIRRERARIGGDWVIAAATFSRQARQVIR